MLIRHAEKPVQNEPPFGKLYGVEFNGTQSKAATATASGPTRRSCHLGGIRK
jgi:hypothetical protein